MFFFSPAAVPVFTAILSFQKEVGQPVLHFRRTLLIHNTLKTSRLINKSLYRTSVTTCFWDPIVEVIYYGKMPRMLWLRHDCWWNIFGIETEIAMWKHFLHVCVQLYFCWGRRYSRVICFGGYYLTVSAKWKEQWMPWPKLCSTWTKLTELCETTFNVSLSHKHIQTQRG